MKKKCFILLRNNRIELVSSNLKTCYDSLMDSVRESDKERIISYSQMTRRFKKNHKFFVNLSFQLEIEIIRFPVYASYKKSLLFRNTNLSSHFKP